MAPYSKHTFSSSLVQTECHQRLHPREQRRPPARQRPHVPETRRGRGGGGNPTLSTSTRSWSRFTQTLVYPARLCPSWTPLSTTSSSVSPLKQAGWHTTTEGVPLPPERSRPLSVCSSPENWPNMPCLREPRLWPSTPAPSKQSLLNTTNSVLSGPPLISQREISLKSCYHCFFQTLYVCYSSLRDRLWDLYSKAVKLVSNQSVNVGLTLSMLISPPLIAMSCSLAFYPVIMWMPLAISMTQRVKLWTPQGQCLFGQKWGISHRDLGLKWQCMMG